MKELVLTKNFHIKDSYKIDVYISNGGYEALKKAFKMKPEEIVEEVKKSNLRGRGGAGFPTGLKWSFVPKESKKPKYLAVNADEGEPGTFKDRQIMEKDPHMLIEGIIITSYAVGIHDAYIYIRGEFTESRKRLEEAIAEAYEKKFLGKNILNSGFDLDITVYKGAGSYVCGEETGLLESLEGKRGWPRLKPPFPAAVGLYQGPTVINNVETLANIPHIIMKGSEWFAKLGVERSGGTKLYCVSGCVNKPGVYELPMGTPLKEIIYEHAGGIKDNKRVKAIIPGGSSTPPLTAEEIDVKMDFDSLAQKGTMLGSAGIIVMDEDTCMVNSLLILSKFYAHESCGQCTPCREGTPWMKKIVEYIEEGKAEKEDIDMLMDIAESILGKTLCPLGDAAAMPVLGFLKKFRPEFEKHIENRGCPFKK
jgi:NADH-quinone oxidoreductase subunit F